MDCTACLAGANAVLNCIPLRLITDDEVDYRPIGADWAKQLNNNQVG